MSKLIIEMEMPRNMCCDCEISIDGFACKKSRMDGGKCPIKGVLPEEHGDLIDRDIMYKQIQLWKSTATDTITRCFLYHVERLLMCIRPTIAAERK